VSPARNRELAPLHVGPGHCSVATPDKMCSACRASLGYPFDLAALHREVDGDGIGWDHHSARAKGLPPPVVVFVRGDGWSLGASEHLEAIAHGTWAGSWQFFARAEDGWQLRPMSEYALPGHGGREGGSL